MSNIPEISVKFLGNKTVIFKNSTLLSVTDKLLNEKAFAQAEPMLITFSTGKQLYFKKDDFYQFFNNKLTVAELFLNTETEGLWRNKHTIVYNKKIDIDPGSLWTKKANFLTLVDDDWNVSVKFEKELFSEI